eukprot:CAMPEP_0168381680 /NCGR_PEP_ID=MMETSP0228-20121227/13001_1 /TAXON_ID=133427 /ORGANISM="Protoceratium reticulatum, Strain CCCM 535 (=CCMP 1889)" /LENGTH=582 /DNA_ID=CAMNT_0008394785 /DNA_START=49 /DNA_END=1797 /DNA_ORIENTATION=-
MTEKQITRPPADGKQSSAGKDSWLYWFIGASSLSEFYDLEGWRRMTTSEKLSFVKNEAALGITICFAQIPESVAFAFMAHIKPPVAIHAAWVVGLICSLFGGRTGMVNGAEGAFAAIIATLIPEPIESGGNGEGIELLFPSVMVCGVFMLLIWLTGAFKFIGLVPASVMLGFCNGLAVVIGWSQLHPFQEGHGDDKHWVGGAKLWFMLLEMIIAMLIMEFLPKIPCSAAKLLPSSLLAIISSIVLEFALVRPIGHRTDVIGDVQEFTLTYPYPFFLHEDYDMSLIGTKDIPKILLQGLLLAVAGIVQGLLTTEVVYDFLKTPTNRTAVCLSCGIANVVSGFLGGMGGDAMIGLSTINCLNGGTGRLGPTLTALGIMVCMHGAYPLLNYIPVASLAGVMIVVVLHTFKWFSVPMVLAAPLPESWRKPLHLPTKVDRFDMLIVATVTTVVIVFNLVYAVGIGLVLAALRYAWETSQEINIEESSEGTTKVYKVNGAKLFFGTSMRFHTNFDYFGDPDNIMLVLDSAPADYSAVTALAKVEGLYKKEGKTVTIHFGTPNFITAPEATPPPSAFERHFTKYCPEQL